MKENSIEEAVNYLKENLKSWKDARPDLGNTYIVEEVDKDYKAIEVLLTAYEKEKEKNRQGKMRIAQLKNEITARIEDVNQYYTPNGKIKAKTEELDEEIKVKREIAKNPMDRVSGRLLTDSIVELEKTKKVLQSLLVKE